MREFRDVLRDGRFIWSAVIFAVLLLAALATGWQRAETARAIQEQAQDSSNTQFYKQGDKNPHSGAHYGNYAFKQVGPLAFFDSGIDPYAGTLLFMEAHKQNLALSPPAGDQNSMIRFGELNGATILQLLLPLLIIFLAFPSFAGERERGTLRQLMSMGVGGHELLWGKALGIGAAILLVIAPLPVAGLIMLLAGLGDATDQMWLRAVLLLVAYLAYAGSSVPDLGRLGDRGQSAAGHDRDDSACGCSRFFLRPSLRSSFPSRSIRRRPSGNSMPRSRPIVPRGWAASRRAPGSPRISANCCRNTA